MNFRVPFVLCVLLFAVLSSCKHSTEPKPVDSTVCDTCKHPCDTCGLHGMDTTSHTFTWLEMTIPAENDMTGVWVFSPTDIVAVNDVMYRYDGATWTKWDLRRDNGDRIAGLSGSTIFGFSSSDFWLTHLGLVYHCNGKSLTKIDVTETGPWTWGVDGALHAAWGTSSHDMFFVGDSGTILHYDGTTWTKFPKVTQKGIGSIWGRASNDIWAAGFDPQTAESVLLHYDGLAWTEADYSKIGDVGKGRQAIAGVWCCESASHSKVYIYGSLVWHRTDNGPWVCDSGKIGNEVGGGQFIGLFFGAGNDANDFVIGADCEFVTHWNGRTWHRYDAMYNPGSLSESTHELSYHDRTLCIVGVKNNSSWILIGQRK